ncbi:MAG: hypothetical protein IJ083_08025 [Clostridia bacterium]|nr:hypothetical protein [Clostridia bacterium]
MEKMCIYDTDKVCDNCYECRCDLDPEKICDNCMECVKGNVDYRAIVVEDFQMEEEFKRTHPDA